LPCTPEFQFRPATANFCTNVSKDKPATLQVSSKHNLDLQNCAHKIHLRLLHSSTVLLSSSGDHDYSLLGCEPMQSDKQILTFPRNLLPLFSGTKKFCSQQSELWFGYAMSKMDHIRFLINVPRLRLSSKIGEKKQFCKWELTRAYNPHASVHN
jgi:hypothetical protein